VTVFPSAEPNRTGTQAARGVDGSSRRKARAAASMLARLRDTAGLDKALGFALTAPRTVTPAQPFAVYGGIRVKL
jgi:hypothetical protein